MRLSPAARVNCSAWSMANLTFAPVKAGMAPDPDSSLKVSVWKGFKVDSGVFKSCRYGQLRARTDRDGSERTVTASSPVFVSVVVTLRFATSSTAAGAETERRRLGDAETLTAARMNEATEARMMTGGGSRG